MTRSRLGILALIAAAFTVVLFVQTQRTTAASEATDSVPAKSREAPAHPRPNLTPFRAGEPTRIVGTVLDAEGRRAVPDAVCTLSTGQPTWAFSQAAKGKTTGTETVHTDAQGRFRFNAPDGPYKLKVEAEGFSPWHINHLRAGDDREVALRPATLLDIVVRDGNGQPVPEARIELLESFRRVDEPPVAVATTDAVGSATLTAITPGDNYLSLVHPRYQYAVEVVELEGRSGSVRVELEAKPGTRLRGRVSSAPGLDAPTDPHVRIEAYSRGQSVVLEMACDSEGNYETEALFAPGETIRLTASDAGFGQVQSWTLIPMAPEQEGQVVDLSFGAAERTVRGRAVDGRGNGLAGASVHMTSISPVSLGQGALVSSLMEVPQHPERWELVGTTNAEGEFEIGRLGSDLQYVLALSDPLRGLGPVFSWTPLAAPKTTSELGNIELVEGGELWGVLRYADGSPAVNESVSAHLELIVSGAEFDTWRPSLWWRPLLAPTRTDGFFRFARLAPGAYDLKWNGELLDNRSVSSGSVTGPVELFLKELPPAAPVGRIVGKVTDASGTPLANTFVALFEEDAGANDDPVSMTFTGIDGEYDLNAPGHRPFHLRVSDMRGRFVEFSQPIAELSKMSAKPIQLEASTSSNDPLLVLVFGPDGLPLSGIDVLVEPPENDFCGCISFGSKTDDTGLAIFEPMADKDHRLIISDPLGRYEPKERRQVRPGDYFEIVFGQ